jgi:hypothetical protein
MHEAIARSVKEDYFKRSNISMFPVLQYESVASVNGEVLNWKYATYSS